MAHFASRVLYVTAGAIGLALFGAGVMAYFVRSFDPDTGVTSDGLGRILSPAPWIAKFALGEDSDWAGWTWFGIDFVVFWGSIGIVALLFKSAEKLGAKVAE